MEDAGIFYGHLDHFTVFCYILWTFGIVCGYLVYFPRLGTLYYEKSGNPGDSFTPASRFPFSFKKRSCWWKKMESSVTKIFGSVFSFKWNVFDFCFKSLSALAFDDNQGCQMVYFSNQPPSFVTF
jgi:hypothetical protein